MNQSLWAGSLCAAPPNRTDEKKPYRCVQMRGVQIDGGVQTDGWLISDALRGSNRGSNSSTVHGQQKQQ